MSKVDKIYTQSTNVYRYTVTHTRPAIAKKIRYIQSECTNVYKYTVIILCYRKMCDIKGGYNSSYIYTTKSIFLRSLLYIDLPFFLTVLWLIFCMLHRLHWQGPETQIIQKRQSIWSDYNVACCSVHIYGRKQTKKKKTHVHYMQNAASQS